MIVAEHLDNGITRIDVVINDELEASAWFRASDTSEETAHKLQVLAQAAREGISQ
jgi:hypothetical protein